MMNKIVRDSLLTFIFVTVFAIIFASLGYKEFPIVPLLISLVVVGLAIVLGSVLRFKHRYDTKFRHKALSITLVLLAISLVIDGVVMAIEGGTFFDSIFISAGVLILVYYYIKTRKKIS